MMRNLKYKGCFWLWLLICSGAVLPASAATLQVQVSNPRPTCEISFDGKDSLTYPIGTIARNSVMKHMPFTLRIDCKGTSAIKTALTARNVTGSLQGGDDSVMMLVEGQTVANAPLLWLEKSNNQRVKLTGLQSDAFCSRSDTSASVPNICQLKPVTSVAPNSPTGNIAVTVLFDIFYT
ncbi:hypothetical protein QB781_003900 [Salmonella enterica]|nr:hypothetical protein [Salmonella enterica]EIP6687058.1 hypothetical protein [Salmonella enterica subsp. enterica serovar Javiana]EIP6743313.1 hypothetical protein [Salmonella enterica subsp. enterica serovar Javiana]EIQ4670009.1 hypothetical protein [Salmonella enterica subsp. enterica serovar Javiana]EIR2402403.1 hypothetical protein [Salmonella enterica subsp. enterica serovar Javiana]